MNTQGRPRLPSVFPISHDKEIPMKVRLISLTLSAALLALITTACSSPAPAAQPPRTEEITFKSGSFTVVGDLRTPGGRRGPNPVVLFVHGSGPADRTAGRNRTGRM